MRSSLLALAASAASVAAVSQGFNYGSTQTDGSIKDQAAFQAEFTAAKNLVGTSGFTSARLYTMVQGGTAADPTEAIPAAMAAGTTLLLGLWASGGQGGINNEITALKTAITRYGTAFTSIVTGLSVGSEDLYRISPTGIAAMSGYGANPDEIVNYIGQVRAALAGTPLSGVGIGHVDTWTAWVNGSNSAVVSAVDWLGMDAYPYFQNTQANSIENGKGLFYDAYDATVAVAQGKDVWITETGWPVSGSTQGQAVPSTENAKTYWDQVGCPSFGKVNTYWFTLQDAFPTTPNPSFGIVGSTLSTTPLFDLSCSAVSSSSASTTAPSSTSASSGPVSSSPSSVESSSASVIASVTGGGGLSPTLGNGVGSSVTPSTAAPIVTPSSSASGAESSSESVVVSTVTSGSLTTVVTSTPVNTGVANSTTSGKPTSSVFSGVGAHPTGSFVGAMGAILAVAAAL